MDRPQEQVYAVASADRTYRLIVRAMNEGVATVSPRGVILDANPRLGSMTGHSTAELTGTAVLDLIPTPTSPRSPACSMSAPAITLAAKWS
jgi:PAS domain S-box-containing protein